MKSVLISIQPKWVAKITSGEKTIEVRKTRPNIPTPFKCYIYATKSGDRIVLKNDRVFEISKALTGKVVGEFVCDKVYKITPEFGKFEVETQYVVGWKFEQDDCCLTWNELHSYLSGKKGYGLHISDLKIYDKPKELSEFYRDCPQYYSSYEEGICAEMCVWYDMGICKNFSLPITRPPQSWCYVESLGE